ncbi:MAG: hypothetical protein R3A44_00160 [Caldilineaceae bacterium]
MTTKTTDARPLHFSRRQVLAGVGATTAALIATGSTTFAQESSEPGGRPLGRPASPVGDRAAQASPERLPVAEYRRRGTRDRPDPTARGEGHHRRYAGTTCASLHDGRLSPLHR